MDAVRSSKSHCYLVPVIRDLIEEGYGGAERAWWLVGVALRGNAEGCVQAPWYNGELSPQAQAMSEEQLKAFLEAVKADAGLQEKLNAAADVDAVVEIAKDAGFVISADESEMSALLSEDDLENVAGGFKIGICLSAIPCRNSI